MNPTPLQLLGDPNTPDWVKRTVHEGMQKDPLDAIFWSNVVLMAFRQVARDTALVDCESPTLKNPYPFTMKPFNPGRVDPNS